jgi:hypothetical protein
MFSSDPAAVRRRGRFSLGAGAVSVLLMAAVGLSGPSAAVPKLGRRGALPPWYWPVHPTPFTVTAALWIAVIVGTVAVPVGLSALRAGWRPDPVRLVAAGGLAAAVLAVTPPVGSTDMMDYATYGRIAALGHNPHVMTPYELRRTGDPVARLSSKAWRHTPSVYGPVATATEWAASRLGGASAARTVWWLKLGNALAFLLVALALDRLAGPDQRRRVRAHLLWTLNPLMLWAVIAGGHIDGVAAALALAGWWALRPGGRRPLLAGVAGGLLLGGAAAVKAPFALLAAGPAWSARRSPLRLAAMALGVLLAVVPGYLLIGVQTGRSLIHRGEALSPLGLWRLAADPGGMRPPAWLLTWGTLLIIVVLTAVYARALPAEGPERQGVRVALALCLAWVITTPVYHPWYEVMIFPLLALLPASRADLLLVVRAGVGALGCIPGVAQTVRVPWLSVAVLDAVVHYAVPFTLLLLFVVLTVTAGLRIWVRPSTEPPVADVRLPEVERHALT